MNIASSSRSMERFGVPFIALVLGLSLALLIAAIAGENPLTVLSVLLNGAFGSSTQLGYSLFYMTPLVFTGLSVAWALRAGLFNIGAEGQMVLGGLAMSVVGILAPRLPSPVAIPLALLAAFVVGGLWGGLAGWLKARRGCHEVLTTILMNFIAYGISGFLILTVFKDPDSQVPETAAVGEGYRLSQLLALGGSSPLSTALFAALAAALVYGIIFKSSVLGFRQRLTGAAPHVARRAGLDVGRETTLAMFMAGGLAGLAGMGLILGFAHKTREGFSAGMGFIGIAVALLGRNSAVGIVLAALLFGALTKGALDLDLDTENVTRDLAVVIQALVVLAIASQKGLLQAVSGIGGARPGDPARQGESGSRRDGPRTGSEARPDGGAGRGEASDG